MDPLSHALTGAALAMLCGPSTHLRAAALGGAAVALLPDLDVLIRRASDPLLQLEMHRHFSHSLLFALAVALVLAALLARRTEPSLTRWFAALAPATLSAGLLDACTSYGVHLLWPFTDERVAWYVVAVVDPLYTVVLLVLVGVALWRRSVVASGAGVIAAAAYLTAGALQHERADWAARSLAASRDHQPERVLVKPTIGNILLWRSVYVAEGQVYVDAIRLGMNALVYPGTSSTLLHPRELELPEASVLAGDVARFVVLSDGYLVRHPRHADVLGDARFAMQPDSAAPMFGIRLDVARVDSHAPFVELREWDAEALARFKAMLYGEALPGIDERPAAGPIRDKEAGA